MTTRTRITADSVPRFPRGVRFEFNGARDRWLILAPERMLMPDETAVAILQRCNGTTGVADIIDGLAAAYDAPRDVIGADVIELLQNLADKGLIDS